MACTLTRAVWQSLGVDTLCIAEVYLEEIGDFLVPHQGTPADLKGEYSVLKWWY